MSTSLLFATEPAPKSCTKSSVRILGQPPKRDSMLQQHPDWWWRKKCPKNKDQRSVCSQQACIDKLNGLQNAFSSAGKPSRQMG